MDTHLICYVDFLGVKRLVRDVPTDAEEVARINSFQQLLHDVADLRGAFQVIEQPIEAGRQFIVKPEISTFSDHIVISFNMEALKSMGGNEFFSGLISIEKLISSLAAEALNLGLLIRGGIAVGPVHHEGGVVLGPAMVEAYELESSLAIYPRVVMSPALYSELRANFDLMLVTDFDGVIHLNYFRRFLSYSNRENQLIVSWNPQARDQLNGYIENLRHSRQSKEVAKWVWLRNSIEQEIHRHTR